MPKYDTPIAKATLILVVTVLFMLFGESLVISNQHNRILAKFEVAEAAPPSDYDHICNEALAGWTSGRHTRMADPVLETVAVGYAEPTKWTMRLFCVTEEGVDIVTIRSQDGKILDRAPARREFDRATYYNAVVINQRRSETIDPTLLTACPNNQPPLLVDNGYEDASNILVDGDLYCLEGDDLVLKEGNVYHKELGRWPRFTPLL